MSQRHPNDGAVATQPHNEVILPPAVHDNMAVQAAPQTVYPQAQGPGAGQAIAQQIRTPETKEFFKTSEFFVWLLGVAGLLIASGMIDDALDAPLTWRLISFFSIGYILSRGFAKAAARRGDTDIQRDYARTSGYGQQSAGDRASDFAQRHIATRETKESFKSSELSVWFVTVASIFIAAGVVDVYDAGEAWTHATWVSVAYIVSRGLSKLGTRQDSSGGPSAAVR